MASDALRATGPVGGQEGRPLRSGDGIRRASRDGLAVPSLFLQIFQQAERKMASPAPKSRRRQRGVADDDDDAPAQSPPGEDPYLGKDLYRVLGHAKAREGLTSPAFGQTFGALVQNFSSEIGKTPGKYPKLPQKGLFWTHSTILLEFRLASAHGHRGI